MCQSHFRELCADSRGGVEPLGSVDCSVMRIFPIFPVSHCHEGFEAWPRTGPDDGKAPRLTGGRQAT